MRYLHTRRARFLSRPNRFVAQVEAEGEILTVHVKNTGRCKELLTPGTEVILVPGDNPARKTRYDLCTVYKPSLGWVNIDSQAPNTVVAEWLSHAPACFPPFCRVLPEYNYGASRMDFCLEGDTRTLLEVKGCTLERDGIGYFPDAPTQRGVRHLHELTAAVKQGWACALAFVIALPGVRIVRPNTATHPAFAQALEQAARAGVRILFLPCHVTPEELTVLEAIEAPPPEEW